jgi:uncharacterized protein (TIGR00369 family)
VSERERNIILAARNDHHCFGCGTLNPCGLQLRFEREERGVSADFTPDRRHEGYAEIVHGGIVATLLDEVMAWALYDRGIWAVTARLHLTFRRPLQVGTPVRATGWLVADRGRLIEVAGEVRRTADGAVLAEAGATFARVREPQAASWRERYLAESAG